MIIFFYKFDHFKILSIDRKLAVIKERLLTNYHVSDNHIYITFVLTVFSNDKILVWIKQRAAADNRRNVTIMLGFAFDRLENKVETLD